MRTPRAFLVALALTTVVLARLPAQCVTSWQPGEPSPGPDNDVYDVAWWDPDGSGPATEVLVLAGGFEIPCVGARNLATYDPATGAWGAFPEQPDLIVRSLAVLSSGELVIGGAFSHIGTGSFDHIASWDGSAWSDLAGGLSGGSTIFAVAELFALPSGDLLVGGHFTQAGGVATSGLARWDGTRWHAFPQFDGVAGCFALRPNGNLIVGGGFHTPGATTYANLAEWDGTNWHVIPGLGSQSNSVSALGMLPNDKVIVSGSFIPNPAQPHNHIACWDFTTSSWSLFPGFEGQPKSFRTLPNGDLLAAPVTVVSTAPVLGVARFDGSQWTPYATRIGDVDAMADTPNGDLIVAGRLDTILAEPIRGIARWDGSAWHALGHGFDDEVRGLAALPNGDVVAFGAFQHVPNQQTSALVRWSGSSWWPMQPSASGPFWTSTASCGAIDDVGDLWLAGVPTHTYSQCIARWTGVDWDPIATASGASCMAFDGPEIYVGSWGHSNFGEPLLRYDGTQWNDVGDKLDGPVHELLVPSAGGLITAGEFLYAGSTPLSRIGHWDGTAWHPLGAGLDGPVFALAELPNGDLVAGGQFYRDATGVQSLGLVARWDGTAWHPLGAGLAGSFSAMVHDLLVLPNGDVLVGGEFDTAGGAPAANLARWNGTSWSAVDGGIDGPVLALAQSTDGTVFASGRFQSAGGHLSAHVARLETDCPANVTNLGQGCAGSAGMLALDATALPWTGSSYRATCYGVSPTALVADVLGLQSPQLPLIALHPTAGLGCHLLASDDAVFLRVPAMGATHSNFTLANDPAFAGLTLYHQVIVGELAGSQLTRLSSSNGLRLILGTF